MKIGFETSNCSRHGAAYYGELVNILRKEFGNDFETFHSRDDQLKQQDSRYDLIIQKFRPSAQIMVNECSQAKSFLIDHGPIHNNRTPIGRAHFEVFSSPTLMENYIATGLAPVIKAYSGGFFLTNHLDTRHPQLESCLIYLIHWAGTRANSLIECPFTEEDTLLFICKLASIFQTVYVVNHVDDQRVNLATRCQQFLPSNIHPVSNGLEFQKIICNVRAVVFEYSSVFATALWNPEVRLFQRRPRRPAGPLHAHNKIFHDLMDYSTYLLENDDTSDIVKLLAEDPKKALRKTVKRMIYDENINNPYDIIVTSIKDALAV